MDRLPVELITIICLFLDPNDVGHLRSASKFYATVGRPFMFRHLHLAFTPGSFERLHAVSSDPALAPYVISLHYEADTLPFYKKFEDWQQAFGRDFMNPPSPERGSERTVRAYRRDFKKLRYTAYRKHIHYSKQQDAMRAHGYHSRKVVDAISRLSNLQEIVLSLEHWAGGPSKAMKKAYFDSLVMPYGHNSRADPHGVPQMLSLLQGSARAQMKLKRLSGGIIDWKFFKQSDGVFKDVQKAVQNLQELKLEFSAIPGTEEVDNAVLDCRYFADGRRYLESKVLECLRYLKDGRVKEFLVAAPKLKLLDLRFDSNFPAWIRHFPVSLGQVVGKHKWEFLADVTLSGLGCRAGDLEGFCATHAMTLRRLVMNRISMDQGSWALTLWRMRRVLHLDEVEIYGHLRAYGSPREDWTFAEMESKGETTMSRVIQEYLLQGGNGPVLDLSQYEDLTFVELQ